MPKYLTIHHENNPDEALLQARWTEIARDTRADWQVTLFNVELGVRFCEWDAPNPEAIQEIFEELGIAYSEILEVETTSASDWRLWELKSRKVMQNCWEIKACGREPGGYKVEEIGVCPASTEQFYYGKNRGLFAGRYCWKVVGTFCDNRTQKSMPEKTVDCGSCKFFHQVRREEGDRFEP